MFVGYFHVIWDTMLLVAFGLPWGTLTPEKKMQFIRFMQALMPLVPCPGCSIHAVEYINTHPLDPKTGEEAVEYIVNFHNEINRRTQKRTYTVQEAKQALEKRLERDFKDYPRTQIIQLEGEQKIQELQAELNILKNLPHAVTNQGLQIYLIIALVAIFVVLFLLIAMFIIGLHSKHKVDKFSMALATHY